MMGPRSSWVVSLMHTIKEGGTLEKKGYTSPAPGVTACSWDRLGLNVTCCFEMPDEIEEIKRIVPLQRHYADIGRAIVAVDASSPGSVAQLLEALRLVLGQWNEVKEKTKLLVVATKTDQEAALSLEEVDQLFTDVAASVKESRCAAIGLAEAPGVLDESLAWLRSS